MKRTSFLKLAVLSGMVFLAGCRYSTICEELPSDVKANSMSLQEASGTVKEMIEDVPAGHHPDHPGDKALGKYTTSIRLRTHNRTGLVLVEVLQGSRVTMEFYVRTRADGEKFANAVWRLRQEYQGK